MIDDPDIIRAAKLLIDQRGISAAYYAKRRAAELQVRGYIEASELWHQVATAIGDQQRGRR